MNVFVDGTGRIELRQHIGRHDESANASIGEAVDRGAAACPLNGGRCGGGGADHETSVGLPPAVVGGLWFDP